MLRYLILSAAAILLALPCYAAEIVVGKALVLDINLAEGWSLYLDPPEALVAEMARHIAHEPAAAKATAAQIESVALKRLAANEAIVYHAASGAYLTIDFSPLEPGETAPGSSALRSSARSAAKSLAGEEEVTEVVWDVTPCKVGGAGEAFQLAADYRQHSQPMKFLGIIGYVEGYWFYLYYIDPGEDPAVFREMQAMLEQVAVRRVGH
jgi:hypothetical protein